MAKEDSNQTNQEFNSNSNPYDLLLKQVAKDDLEGAVEDFLVFERALKRSGHYEWVVLISANLNRLKEQEIKNIISKESYNLQRNQICDSLTYIISSVEKAEAQPHYRQVLRHFGAEFNRGIPILTIITVVLIGVLISKILNNTNTDTVPKNLPDPSKTLVSSLVTTKKFIGLDRSGKAVNYISYIIRGFSWAKNETDLSKKNNIQQGVCNHLINEGVISRMNKDNLIGIVCFGNASYGEDTTVAPKDRLTYEEDRAKERAISLANCVGKYLIKSTPINILNLGKCLEWKEDTEYQRQILVIGIVNEENGAISEEALFDGLEREFRLGNINLDIRTFSKVKENVKQEKLNRLDISKYLN